MKDILEEIYHCIESGKINRGSAYPPDMKEKDGAYELTNRALDEGVSASDILEKALIPAMAIIGKKFSKQEIFVPQMLLSAKAMSEAMRHLKPYFQSGETKRKGLFIIGTVTGDLHDIGKNLAAMIIEGGGWEVIDLGVDVKKERFIELVKEHPYCVIGLSALLTTTMVNMEDIVRSIKDKYPGVRIIIGGAPVTNEFCAKIGADLYASDPQCAVDYLAGLV